jgi:hypothetical protein
MNLRIEDVRKFISGICTWLTVNDDLSFLKDERNQPRTENSEGLTKQLGFYGKKNRVLLNALSNSVEDTEVCKKNLRAAIEKEKETRRNKKEK